MVCALALAGWVLASGAGCASGGFSGSLGNIDASREPLEHPEITVGEVTSEWETLREASQPAWVGDHEQSVENPPTVPEREEARPRESGSDEPRTPGGNPDDALVVVDREHGIPPDYTPDDLVPLQPLGIQTLRGERMKLRDEAAEAAARMLADAREAGFYLTVCSAYRSHEAQVVSHGRLTAIYGEGAQALIAPPGHSEHQLGTVIDVSNAQVDYRLLQSFGETEASEWLRQYAADYGFVLSYPRGAEEHTGYRWEPWHYRYIGRDNAREYRAGDYDSPQRFFAQKGVRPGE